MMRIPAFFPAILLVPVLVAAAPVPTREEVLEKAAAPWTGVDSIAFNVRRDVFPVGAQPVTQSWRYVYAEPEQFILRTFSPPPLRELYGNHEEVWEYLPIEKKALVTSIAHVTPERRRQLFERAIGGFNVPFLLVQEDLPLLPGMTVSDGGEIDGRPAVRITGTPNRGGVTKVEILLDRERWCVLAMTISDDRGGSVRGRHDRFRELRPGTWMPLHIAFDGTSEGRVGRFEVTLSGVELSPQLSPKAFAFTPPADVEIIRHTATTGPGAAPAPPAATTDTVTPPATDAGNP